jgi:hypothetical protein
MKRSGAAALVLALLTGFLIVITPFEAAAFDRDCSDFSNQKQAQIYYLNKGGPQLDPDDLDRDNDGIACDSNPCPCYYGSRVPHQTPARRTVRTKVHLSANHVRRIAGEPVRWTISVNPDRVRSVRLQRHASDGSWRTVARGHTSRHGVWKVRRPTRDSTTSYRAVVARQVTHSRIYTKATSRSKKVRTQRQEVLLSLPDTKVKGQIVRATIQASPIRRGREVLLQRRTSSGWETLFEGHENRNGAWTHSWTVKRVGDTTYRALVWRGNGARKVGTTATMTVVPPDTAPATPTNLVVTPADGSVTLTWDPVLADDLASYRIQYSSTPDVWTTIDEVPPGSETGYAQPGLSNGTEYQFRVAAVDDAGNVSDYTAAVPATPSP